jgi:hypothetical protein
MSFYFISTPRILNEKFFGGSLISVCKNSIKVNRHKEILYLKSETGFLDKYLKSLPDSLIMNIEKPDVLSFSWLQRIGRIDLNSDNPNDGEDNSKFINEKYPRIYTNNLNSLESRERKKTKSFAFGFDKKERILIANDNEVFYRKKMKYVNKTKEIYSIKIVKSKNYKSELTNFRLRLETKIVILFFNFFLTFYLCSIFNSS